MVHYCIHRIEESMDETLLEDLDEDSAVIHSVRNRLMNDLDYTNKIVSSQFLN